MLVLISVACQTYSLITHKFLIFSAFTVKFYVRNIKMQHTDIGLRFFGIKRPFMIWILYVEYTGHTEQV